VKSNKKKKMEEKKRPAEDPLEGGHGDEKRLRRESFSLSCFWREKEQAKWRDCQKEFERLRPVVLDPDTWSKHVVDGSERNVQKIVRDLEWIFTREKPSNFDGLTLENIRSLPPVVFESRLFTTIILNMNKSLLSLPSAIGAWTGTDLSLIGTGITHLPHEIGDCQQLQIVDLIKSNIQELPRSLGKCPMLGGVYLDFKATSDPKRPLLSQFAGHTSNDVAWKLKRDWDAYVTRMSCFLFCIESRICKLSPEFITGDLPCDILARIGSFL
jgi:hypothetical protein